jgi:hypothetical protein
MIDLPYKIENEKLFKKYLKHMEVKLSNYTPLIPIDSEHFAVITEPRISEDMLPILKTFMYCLNETNSNIKWGLQIFHGIDNEDFIKEITKGWNVHLEKVEVNDFSKIEFNTYYKSLNFWERVKGKKVLCFQIDSILLRSGIDEFLEYDYIGAPWIKSKENYFVGNGGLSLRTKERMIELSKNYFAPTPEWEDIFFVKHLENKNVADVETAMKFSVEDVYSPNPLGIHNPIKIPTNLLKNLLVI